MSENIPPPPPPPLGNYGSKSSHNLSKSSMNKSVAKHLKDLQKTPGNVGEKRDQIKQCCDVLLKADRRALCVTLFIDDVTSVIQEGPKCGLVAICMAAKALGKSQLDIEDVYQSALSGGYTKQGEMFSADNLLDVAKSSIPCEGCVITGDNMEKRDQLIKHLIQGHPVLVPYDCDVNYEPCRKFGHKAHWALLSGLVFVISEEAQATLDLRPTTGDDNFIRMNKDDDLARHLKGSQVDAKGLSVYVIANQGKSLRTHLWDLDKLLASNGQLCDVDQNIAANASQWIVQDLGKNLKDKIVFLFG